MFVKEFDELKESLICKINWWRNALWNYCKSLIALIQQKVSASLNWNMRLLFTE